MTESISVIIPTKNRIDATLRCVKSVINQSIIPFEIIVVDDGSSDGTYQKIKDEFPQVIVLRNDISRGGAVARNQGAEVATGEFVAFLDSDDEWMPNHLENKVRLIKSNNSEGSFGTFILQKGAEETVISFHLDHQTRGNIGNSILSTRRFDARTSTMVFIREAFLKVKFDENLKKHQDWDLAINFDREFQLTLDNEPTIRIYIEQKEERMSQKLQHPSSFYFIEKNKYHLNRNCIFMFCVKQIMRSGLAKEPTEIKQQYLDIAQTFYKKLTLQNKILFSLLKYNLLNLALVYRFIYRWRQQEGRVLNLNKEKIQKQTRGMKILQLVTKRQYRGAELFAADLSKELINLGHSVAFVGIYKNEDDLLYVENADNRDLVSAKTGKFSFKIVKEIVKLINEIKPDVIQCNGSDTLKYTVAASFFVRNVPIVYRNISIISEWISSRSKKFLYKKMFNRITHVTSVGNEALADFIETYKFPENRAEVIRRGIPIKKVDELNLPQKLREELGLNPSVKIATHIGNFSPEKNHDFLLDVFSELKEEQPEIKLLCVGSGVLYEKIKTEISRRGLEESVYLLGFRRDIPSLLAASDCLVLCSRVEGVPGVILEAGIQRTPSIATNVGGVSEVLVDGETGFLIERCDKDMFKDRLVQIMTDEELRKHLGENAYKMVSKGYDPVENARQFADLYLRLTKSIEPAIA